MSLWHIDTVASCMAYIDNGACYPPPGPPSGYNPELLTCPRHYQQSTWDIANFFYEPGSDKLVVYVTLHATYWPWDIQRYEFSAADGSWLNQAEVLARQAYVDPWAVSWTRGATMGSYNKIYACRRSETKIWEIDWPTGQPQTNGWNVDPYTWTPQSSYTHAVVNRVDNYLAGVSGPMMDCWRNIASAPERFGQLRLPNSLGYLAYENRNYCWLITKDGVILKADYQVPRWEMISRVQDPSEDAINYFITYDTKRKRVVVFRQMPDAADGACQHQLEFYYPMVDAAQLTQPVPVTSLRTGNRILLAAHLIGDAGEGVTPYTVNGELADPATGRLVTTSSGTELNGRVCFQYQAPEVACTETLEIAVSVEET